MKPKQVATGVFRVPLGGVNVFLVEADQGLVLIDAGLRRSPAAITEAIYSLGRSPDEVRAIVATHLHADHTGGLAEMKRRTGAEVWMHPLDAALVRVGVIGRPLQPGSGFASRVVVGLSNRRPVSRGEPIAVEHEVGDGDELPFAGLRAVHTPGHTAGHLSLLLSRHGGVLFVGDAAANMARLGMGAFFEDRAEARRSLAKLAALEFEVACFAHGRPIRARAAARFRARFASAGATGA
jgi:glyoxylase-like metal-dependent hydrolase (beta-lactamase superfamily II)